MRPYLPIWVVRVGDELFVRCPLTPTPVLEGNPPDDRHGTGHGAVRGGAEKMFGDFAPGLVHFTDDVLFGEVWRRPQLSPKERSLITVAALTAWR